MYQEWFIIFSLNFWRWLRKSNPKNLPTTPITVGRCPTGVVFLI
jgi:hypothetical protein